MSNAPLYPLRFHPILRRYLWGGRRLAQLGKPIGDQTCAESWEICDRDDDQSVVAEGPLAGSTLRKLIETRGPELLGARSREARFPLLIKLLDTEQPLSVQVHPDDRQAAALDPPERGKTEAWVVLDAKPGSFLLAGLKRGFDRQAFARELHRGTAELCLARFEPRAGDCFFIPAGTVHALGPGLLVAEVQQSSDVTYRLWDWNRVDAEGRSRELHLAAGLAAVDDRLAPTGPVDPQPTDHAACQRLVDSDYFRIDRWTLTEPLELSLEDHFRVLLVVGGAVSIEWAANKSYPARQGETYLLPACLERVRIAPHPDAVALEISVPQR